MDVQLCRHLMCPTPESTPAASCWQESIRGRSTGRRPLVANILQQLFHLGLLVGGQWQERQPHGSAEEAVVIHRVLHAGNAQSADDPLGGLGNALLLFASQGGVAVLPRGINLVTRGRSAIG